MGIKTVAEDWKLRFFVISFQGSSMQEIRLPYIYFKILPGAKRILTPRRLIGHVLNSWDDLRMRLSLVHLDCVLVGSSLWGQLLVPRALRRRTWGDGYGGWHIQPHGISTRQATFSTDLIYSSSDVMHQGSSAQATR